LTVLEQIRRQHFAVTHGVVRLPTADCRFQLFDTGQATQGAQQAAHAAHRGTQIVQRFRIGAGTQASLTGQQTNFQPKTCATNRSTKQTSLAP
jgi:hypothetical protein